MNGEKKIYGEKFEDKIWWKNSKKEFEEKIRRKMFRKEIEGKKWRIKFKTEIENKNQIRKKLRERIECGKSENNNRLW